jgi:Ser/Thr protein kinase RdoA (MazF antagonist)
MNKAELGDLARRFGVDVESFRLLKQDSRHRVYEYELNGRKLILKTTHGPRSHINLIRGELDWINYLYDNGVRVPKAVCSANGRLVEAIEINSLYLLAYSLERLESCDPWDGWNSDLIQKLGQVMGQMHALTRNYKPSEESIKRPEWFEKDWLKEPDKVLHPSHGIIIGKCHELREKLSLLSFDRDSYGLIHDDLHTGNLIVSSGEFAVIDFDCCHYTWLVSDMASALLFAIWKTPESNMEYIKQFAIHFMKNLLTGYNTRNHIDSYWVEQIPLFLKLREMSHYVSSGYENQDVKDINPDQRLFFYWKYNIENDVPYVEADFSRI